MKRNATAVWNGSLKEGAGKISTQSTTLKNTQYSFKSRFEEGVGTNPEELVAAAHSGCFTMQLSAYIGETDAIHVFEFETSLMKEEVIKKLNKDILDFPVAIIHFDYEKASFSYNKEYSAYIKRELHNTVSASAKGAREEILASLEVSASN